MRDRNKSKKSNSLKYLTLPFLALAILYFGLEFYVTAKQKLSELNKQKQVVAIKPKVITPPITIKQPKSAIGIVTLTADAYGHFRGKVLINNVSMPFLIDTGATKTVIPEKMALEAKLPLGKKVETNTAGGKVFAYQTQIDTFNIQGVQINKLNAQVNPYLHEVLIGMNTLKYFNMTLNGPHLTLVTNGFQTTSVVAVEPATKEVKVEKKPSVIIKRKVCDKNNICRTVFSDF